MKPPASSSPSSTSSAAAPPGSGATTSASCATATAAPSPMASALKADAPCQAPAMPSAFTPSPSPPTWWAARWPSSPRSRLRTRGNSLRSSAASSWSSTTSAASPAAHAPSMTLNASSIKAPGTRPSDCEHRLRPHSQPPFGTVPSGRFTTPFMSPKSPEQCLRELRALHCSAFKIGHLADSSVVLAWANSPELWAEHQIRFRRWSFHAAEAVVRQCRILRGRATRALPTHQLPKSDPFDPLMPSEPTQQQQEPEA